MNRDRLWLEYMADCAERIRACAAGGRTAFLGSRMAQDAVQRNLQVISDSYERLSWERRERHLGFPWQSLRGLRNLIVHESQNIDIEALWDVVELDLPDLTTEIGNLRAD